MKHERTSPVVRGTLAFICFSLVAGFAFDACAQPASTTGAPHFVVGTIRTVDTAMRTLEVITAVGQSVRLVRIQAGPDCKFRVPGEADDISSIKRGLCVRVEYEMSPTAPERKIATTIDAVAMDDSGGNQ